MRVLPTAAVALVLLGACSDAPKPATSATTPTTAKAVDTLEVEEVLVTTQKRTTPDLDVRDPACPARVVVTEGATFECTLIVETLIVPYKVTLANVDNPSQTGRYDIRPGKAVILMPKVVAALNRLSPNSRVDCGPEKVKVLEPGQTLHCTVAGAGEPQIVTFRVDDVLGNVSPVAAP